MIDVEQGCEPSVAAQYGRMTCSMRPDTCMRVVLCFICTRSGSSPDLDIGSVIPTVTLPCEIMTDQIAKVLHFDGVAAVWRDGTPRLVVTVTALIRQQECFTLHPFRAALFYQ